MKGDIGMCTCLIVGYDPVKYDDGTLTERWRCKTCGTEFMKVGYMERAFFELARAKYKTLLWPRKQGKGTEIPPAPVIPPMNYFLERVDVSNPLPPGRACGKSIKIFEEGELEAGIPLLRDTEKLEVYPNYSVVVGVSGIPDRACLDWVTKYVVHRAGTEAKGAIRVSQAEFSEWSTWCEAPDDPWKSWPRYEDVAGVRVFSTKWENFSPVEGAPNVTELILFEGGPRTEEYLKWAKDTGIPCTLVRKEEG